MVIEKRPQHIRKEWVIHRLQTFSPFYLTAILSVIVMALLTGFYIFFLDVRVLPIYSVTMSIHDHIGWDNIDKNNTHGDNKNEGNIDREYIEKEFQNQWFRMQRARIDWKGMLVPCGYVNSVKNKTMIGWGQINETSRKMSFVEYMDIRPAGQFSRIFIRTRTKDGRNKTIGGDFWMVSLLLSKLICGRRNYSPVADFDALTYVKLLMLPLLRGLPLDNKQLLNEVEWDMRNC